MIRSMTGFGSATRRFRLPVGEVELSVECRTVNSKFLDFSLRAPRLYLPMEARLKRLTKDYVRRGRLDFTIQRRLLEGEVTQFRVNREQAELYANSLRALSKDLQLSQELQIRDLLHFSDWYEASEVSELSTEEEKALEEVATMALQSLVEARKQEGAALNDFLHNHIEDCRARLKIFRDAKKRLPEELRQRWKERLEEMAGAQTLDATRLEQELLFWAGRSDFSEEVDRLSHHFDSFTQYLEKDSEMGRRLEFLAQEMHREANTLGSKCSDAQLISELIELKSGIEKIREQVLNVE